MESTLSHTRELSEKKYQEALSFFPGGVNSPVRAFTGIGIPPIVIDTGYKDRVIDADGNVYIDFCMSWGALIHGHAHPFIVAETQKQLTRGMTFGALTPLEIELAKKIQSAFPVMEKMRFTSSGTEATMSAARVARGFTGKDLILKFNGNYHGASDSFMVQGGSHLTHLSPTSSSKGIPDDFVKHTISLPFNDCDEVYSFFSDISMRKRIAAVIIEPVAGNMGVVPATERFLSLLREETAKSGALLIFDEVITGFRVGLHGACGLYDIEPDMVCLGKIIGGGLPCAAFGGRKEIMDFVAPLGPVYQGGTLSGNPLAMCAGLKTLELIEKPNFYEELEEKTKLLTKPVKEALLQKGANAVLQEVGSMFTLFFGAKSVTSFEEAKKLDLPLFRECYRFLFEKGIFFAPSQHEASFVSSAHTTESILKTKEALLEMIDVYL